MGEAGEGEKRKCELKRNVNSEWWDAFHIVEAQKQD